MNIHKVPPWSAHTSCAPHQSFVFPHRFYNALVVHAGLPPAKKQTNHIRQLPLLNYIPSDIFKMASFGNHTPTYLPVKFHIIPYIVYIISGSMFLNHAGSGLLSCLRHKYST